MGPPYMILLLLGFVAHSVLAIPGGRLPLPSKNAPADAELKPEHCVQMTPQKEREVNSIVVKLSEYLYNLTLEYEDLDIRLVKIVVESHSENEVEEKTTQVQLVVNDCAYVDDVLVKDDGTSSGDVETQSDGADDEKVDTKEIIFGDDQGNDDSTVTDFISESDSYPNDGGDIPTDSSSDDDTPTDVNTETIDVGDLDSTATQIEPNDSVLIVENSGEDTQADAPVKVPEVYWLNLDEKGNKLVKLYEAKHGKTPLLLYIRKVLGATQYLFMN